MGRPKDPTSKIGKLRNLLTSKKRLTVEHAMSVSGFDRRNMGVALSTLADPNKSDPVIIATIIKTDKGVEHIVVDRVVPGGKL